MSAEFDLIVRGGYVVDGTGLPRRRVDVGVRDGRVAAMAHLDGATAREEIDAGGMVVAPGIVDAHTHYDPQITFDPYATVSCFHGVTTVVAGNCGFSVAPCKERDRTFLEGIFAQVENMDPIALGAITWDEFETFPEFLASRDGRLGVNFACYVGHSNLRRWVMGPDASEREATEAEIAEMRALVADAMAAGAAGVSSSAAPTHLDLDGRPVPSRLGSREELLALAEEAGAAGVGSIAFLPSSAIGGLDATDEDYLIRLSQVSGLPVVIQGLGGRNKTDAPTATWEASQRFLDRATEAGAPVYSMLIARPFDRPIVIDETNFHYMAVPSWNRMLKLPRQQRLALLRDPAARAELRDAVENYNRDPARGTTVPPPLWTAVYVDEVVKPEHEKWQSRSIREMADELGVAPADALLDLALAEDLQTRFRWRTESPEWTAAVGEAQLDDRMIVGTSDGGAHLARDDGADWSSYFLRSWVLDRRVWTLEEGIRQITQVPAALLGLVDRGVLRPGAPADLFVFDAETVGPWRKEFVHDLPGGVGRFKAWGRGVHATVVNGEPIVLAGELTGRLPGQVVRPGVGAVVPR
ncbi:MAG TPA: amidohydrolase family protein [Acidimicrobiia bacterium]|nr:amidohydrolase family protein [Acidimicrobiia bacterium]